MLIGAWKNFEELEKSVTVEELYRLQGSIYKSEHRRNRFAAALKGVDLDDAAGEQEESAFERIKRKAEADLAGKSEQEFVFDMIGVKIDDEDDDQW